MILSCLLFGTNILFEVDQHEHDQHVHSFRPESAQASQSLAGLLWRYRRVVNGRARLLLAASASQRTRIHRSEPNPSIRCETVALAFSSSLATKSTRRSSTGAYGWPSAPSVS